MYGRFVALCQPRESDQIVDVGVTPDRSLPESNFFEALYPHPQMLTATSIEDAAFLEVLYPGLHFVQTGANGLPFEDKQFDIAVSFAVLEHVGNRENQRRFIHELTRVADKVFVTTPDRSFPIEVHTFWPLIHWLPQKTHQRILRSLGMQFWSQTENLNLLYANELRAIYFPQMSKWKSTAIGFWAFLRIWWQYLKPRDRAFLCLFLIQQIN